MYEPKGDSELRQLALDMISGAVFSTDHVRNNDEIDMVFMVLAMMNGEQIKELEDNGASLIYERMDRALPRSVNGLPMFSSFSWLDKSDHEKVQRYIAVLQEFVGEDDDGSGAEARTGTRRSEAPRESDPGPPKHDLEP